MEFEIDSYKISFGDPDIQKEFAARHIDFLKALPDLRHARDISLEKSDKSEFEGRLLVALAQMILNEDFDAIVVLCANGLSTKAMQVLRGMFERVVTLGHLHEHPDQSMLFWNYYWVDLYKAQREFEEAYPGKLSGEKKKPVEENYEKVKGNYQITHCKTCKTTRTNFSWSKMSMVAMAKKLKFPYEFIQHGYYRPLEETHPKVGAVLRRLKQNEDGELYYDEGAKPEEDNITLLLAHFLAITTINILRLHFGIDELEPILKKCSDEHGRIWTSMADAVTSEQLEIPPAS
jgi:Family of unknown function (DUF5677)